jgi:hypothetical protein
MNDRPGNLPPHKPTAPRPAADHGEDPADLPAARRATSPGRAADDREIVVPFSTRVELSISDLVDQMAHERRMTKRAVVEHAIRETYGKG